MRDQRLDPAELAQLVLDQLVDVLVGRLLHPVDREVEEQLILQARVEVVVDPLVVAHALVRHAPQREVAELRSYQTRKSSTFERGRNTSTITVGLSVVEQER